MARGHAVELGKEFQDYVKFVTEKSEHLIRDVFPLKVKQLNTLLESEAFNLDHQKQLIKASASTDPNDEHKIGTNNVIATNLAAAKPFIRELREHTNHLKLWLKLLIPKIEDGDNFGVEIQEEVLGEIQIADAAGELFYSTISIYHMTRGEMIKKASKHSLIDDYKKVIEELDEREFVNLRAILTNVCNYYAAIYDLISKNWDKIMKPRSSNNENMY